MKHQSDPDFPRWCDWCRYCASATSPDEHLPVPIRSQFLDLDGFNLEVFKIVGTEVEAALERPVEHPTLALE